MSTADDASFTANNIGFTFNYNGLNYTQFAVNVNGYVTFSSFVSSSYTPISSASTSILISALGNDLQLGYTFRASITSGSNQLTSDSLLPGMYVGATITGPGIPAGTQVTGISGNVLTLSQNATSTSTSAWFTCLGEIRTETIGNAPNRKCVIQWRNTGRFASQNNQYCFNFQIILHETSNNVEIAYDILAMSLSNSLFQVGLRGMPTNDFNSRTTTTNWQQTTASVQNTNTCTMTSTIKPISGLRFIWVNTAVGVEENIQSIPFSLYPNPASDAVFVQTPAVIENGIIEIFDLGGRVCLTQQISPGTTLLSMNIETLPTGTYHIRISTATGQGTQRLTVL